MFFLFSWNYKHFFRTKGFFSRWKEKNSWEPLITQTRKAMKKTVPKRGEAELKRKVFT